MLLKLMAPTFAVDSIHGEAVMEPNDRLEQARRKPSSMRGMFANIRRPMGGTGLPTDSQCKKCGLFDTSRQDVLAILEREERMHPKVSFSLLVGQARCKCGDHTSEFQVRPRYAE